MARVLFQHIIKISKETALCKDYKLEDQIEASSGSIMDNIAEGFGRGGNAEFIQFLEIANASACECQSQLYRILDKGYIDNNYFQELYLLAENIKGKIISLVNYLNSCTVRGVKFKNRMFTKT